MFVVIEGVATFETLDGTASVRSGEAIRFGPGEYQSCLNDSSDDVELIAMGAPRQTEEFRVPIACPECDRENMRPTITDEGEGLVCPACNATRSAVCPECGAAAMLAVLDDDKSTPISVCQACGVESAPQ